MGGFGANYSYRFQVGGDAEYEGGLGALFKGSYTAAVESSHRTTLQDLLKHRRLRHSDDSCEDAPSAVIRLIFKDGSIVTVTAACGAPRENIEFAARLDSFGSTLRWHSAEAMPPNQGLLQTGADLALRSLAWQVSGLRR